MERAEALFEADAMFVRFFPGRGFFTLIFDENGVGLACIDMSCMYGREGLALLKVSAFVWFPGRGRGPT